MTEQQLPEWADPSVPPADLDPQGVSRRQLLTDRQGRTVGRVTTEASWRPRSPATARGTSPLRAADGAHPSGRCVGPGRHPSHR
ncbi:hypothetical protein GCM10010254_27660 [Streptomyces chromofuscus]|nr:hypothetical protein GCM10010254_27660 [Streptomyces chromofuscus]